MLNTLQILADFTQVTEGTEQNDLVVNLEIVVVLAEPAPPSRCSINKHRRLFSAKCKALMLFPARRSEMKDLKGLARRLLARKDDSKVLGSMCTP